MVRVSAPVPSVNAQGEYALYKMVLNKPVFDRYTKVVKVNKAIIPIDLYPHIVELAKAGHAAGFDITFAVGIRTYESQINSRYNNIIVTPSMVKLNESDPEAYEKLVDDMVMNASPSRFKPETGIPGHSKHQRGTAVDINVTKLDENGKKIGMLPCYAWLIENAIKFGFVRTISSEEWHFEYMPWVKDTYQFVPKGHSSWKTK